MTPTSSHELRTDADESIANWAAFEQFAEQCRDVGHVGRPYLVFRGHARDHGSLLPTLARGLVPYPKESASLAELYVRDAIMPRLAASGHGSATSGDRICQETVLRHFGAPSRLLDWTTSPFVALFFACAHEPESDGELWRASTSAAGLTEPSGNPTEWVELLGWFDELTPNGRLSFISPPQHSSRSAAQQCLFSVSDDPRADHKDLIQGKTAKELEGKLPAWDVHRLRRWIVPGRLKQEFLERLHQRNVHAASLFPDLEGLCRFGGHVLTLYAWKMERHRERLGEEHKADVRHERLKG